MIIQVSGALADGYRESTESWAKLRGLRDRELFDRLMAGDLETYTFSLPRGSSDCAKDLFESEDDTADGDSGNWAQT